MDMISAKKVNLFFEDHKQNLLGAGVPEADEFLHNFVDTLPIKEKKKIDVEILFDDGFTLKETIYVQNSDSLIDQIIQYYVVGNIKYKAGLMINSVEDKEVYLNSIKKLDQDEYKKILSRYQLDFSHRKIHKKSPLSQKVMKTIDKYKKLKSKEESKLTIVSNRLSYINTILDVLKSEQTYTSDEVKEFESELSTLTEKDEHYHVVKGRIDGFHLRTKA